MIDGILYFKAPFISRRYVRLTILASAVPLEFVICYSYSKYSVLVRR